MDVGAVGGGSLAAGLSGLQKGQEQVTQAAQEIASANTQGSQNTTNLSSSLVEQTQGVRQVEASAKVVEAADKTVGSLLDVKA